MVGGSGGCERLDRTAGFLFLALLWSVVVCGQVFASDAAMTADSGDLAEASAGDQARRGILPAGRLFEPLIADQRWPHFSASYQRYLGDGELKDVGAASFGEYFSLYRNQVPSQGGWELGLQAGVFAIFDLGASSQDLVNADYWVGIPVAYRRGDFSVIARLFHQSSHLGDEFLLRNRAERVNLSYEGVDLLLSWDVARQWRLYGGGGYLFHRQPSSLDPGRCRAGIEWRHDDPFFDRMVRPVAAADVSLHQENQWDAEVSARAGVQLENPARRGRHLQLLLEYFKGNSPNGQFFRRRVEYWGVGLHIYLP